MLFRNACVCVCTRTLAGANIVITKKERERKRTQRKKERTVHQKLNNIHLYYGIGISIYILTGQDKKM